MKLGILTQPMSANYGCNLQMYALQTTLEHLGHEVEIINIKSRQNKTSIFSQLKQAILLFLKRSLKFITGRPVYLAMSSNDYNFFNRLIIPFQQKYLHGSKCEHSSSELFTYVRDEGFNGFVVGSDQVWRPNYNINGRLENMFLDFTKDMVCKRISYAASFGVDMWEYTNEQTIKCKLLANKFDAISVREKSGVELCRRYLAVNATHVLDPTLLLQKEDYEKIINAGCKTQTTGKLYYYVLDKTPGTKKCIAYAEEQLGLKSFTYLNPCPEGTYRLFHKDASIFPSVEQWLQGFRDADMVIVDSFHGMVFSIIFNKPFWVVGNTKRGMSRFESLLNLFGLEDRLVTIDQFQTIDLNASIDWNRVNTIREQYVNSSIMFLKKALN